MQNANTSFACLGFKARCCTLQGLFASGFREACWNEQPESSSPVQPCSEMQGKLQCISLSIRISAGPGSRWGVTAPDLFLLKHSLIKVLHPPSVSSTAITRCISRATECMFIMWWSRTQLLEAVEESHVMVCFPISFPSFSQEQGAVGMQQPLKSPTTLFDTDWSLNWKANMEKCNWLCCAKERAALLFTGEAGHMQTAGEPRQSY